MGVRSKITEKIPENWRTKSVFRTKKNNISQPLYSFLDQTSFLQRNLGNQAFQRSYHSGMNQPMLKMNEPGDKYEQEADRVADHVMRMTEGEVLHSSQSDLRIQRICSGCASSGRTCSECGDEGEGIIQAKEMASQTLNTHPGLENQFNSMKGRGQPLPEHTRDFFESRFGADFRHVRVHTDSQAAKIAKGINARAFTMGWDITFGDGEYSPETIQGKQLLAHELTHVVQQSALGSGIIRRQVFLPENEPEQPSEDIDAEDVNVIKPGESIPVIWFDRGTSGMRNDESVDSRRNTAALMKAILKHLNVVGLDADIKFKGYISNAESEIDSGLSQKRADRVREYIIGVFNSVGIKLKYAFSRRSEAIGLGIDDTFEGDEWNQRVDVEMMPPWEFEELKLEGKRSTKPRQVRQPRDFSNCIVIEKGGGMQTICHGGGGWSKFRPSDENSPVEITVVDSSDVMGWGASASRIGEVYMEDVESMIDNVLEATEGTHPISRLNIIDHGNPKSIQIGNDRISLDNVDDYVEHLFRLYAKFSSDGFVHLQHCKIGQNLELVRVLAEIFGVPVYAGTDKHFPAVRFQYGEYVRCDPDQTCETDVGRP